MRWRLLTTNLIGNLTWSFWAGILFWTEICQDSRWWMSHPGEDIRVLEDLRWWFAASPSCWRSFSDSYWNTLDTFWTHLASKTRDESGRKQIGTNMRTWRIFKLFRSWTVQGVCVCVYLISWHFSTSPKLILKKPKNTRLRIPRGCHGIHGNERLWIFMGSESGDDFPLVSLFEDSVVSLKAAPKTLASANGWKVGGGFGMKIWDDIYTYIYTYVFICKYMQHNNLIMNISKFPFCWKQFLVEVLLLRNLFFRLPRLNNYSV